MKKVGREVLFLATGRDNPRNGEGRCPVRPNLKFPSPLSPMQAKNVGKFTVVIFNPVPWAARKMIDDRQYFWRSGAERPLPCRSTTTAVSHSPGPICWKTMSTMTTATRQSSREKTTSWWTTTTPMAPTWP